MGLVDLHLHSMYSDGYYKPGKLMKKAAKAGLRLVSLTDHDSVSGVEEAVSSAKSFGIRCLPGIEVTTDAPYEQHILGYMIDIKNSGFIKFTEELMRLRDLRAEAVFGYLDSKGKGLSEEDVRKFAYGPYIGRPHFASALMARGVVGSVNEAFDDYLSNYMLRDIPRPKADASETINAIMSAGGAAVLAHPHTLRAKGKRMSNEELDKVLGGLCEMGLCGLECNYFNYKPEQVSEYIDLAKKHDLVVTGGSDYHGGNVKPGVEIGSGKHGLLQFDDLEVAEKLATKASRSAR